MPGEVTGEGSVCGSHRGLSSELCASDSQVVFTAASLHTETI